MRKVKLSVGDDGRNRTVLWPFKAKTSRTQPKASEWIFSPAVWLRSLIKPPPGCAIAYVDYSSMEFMIAAVLSDGHCGPVNNMLDMYRSGDPYWSFARRVGAAPSTATKQSHADVRDKYKVMILATQYGMSSETLAGRLGVSTFEAQEMLNQHRELFAQYWKWSDDWVQHSLQTGIMRTAFGWTCRIGLVDTTVNERSIRNWPIQSAGADVLRIACILAIRHGVKLIGPVHDATLIEAPIERIEADVALMQEVMRRASRIVLNSTTAGTHELRTDASIVCHPKSVRGQARRRDLEPSDWTAARAPRAAGGPVRKKGMSESDVWARKRLKELRAAAPERRKKVEPFCKVPMWWMAEATKATRTPKAMVCIHLLHTAWKRKSTTFPLSNATLGKSGVSRGRKRDALRELETAGLITVERRHGRAPLVTLVVI